MPSALACSFMSSTKCSTVPPTPSASAIGGVVARLDDQALDQVLDRHLHLRVDEHPRAGHLPGPDTMLRLGAAPWAAERFAPWPRALRWGRHRLFLPPVASRGAVRDRGSIPRLRGGGSGSPGHRLAETPQVPDGAKLRLLRDGADRARRAFRRVQPQGRLLQVPRDHRPGRSPAALLGSALRDARRHTLRLSRPARLEIYIRELRTVCAPSPGISAMAANDIFRARVPRAIAQSRDRTPAAQKTCIAFSQHDYWLVFASPWNCSLMQQKSVDLW